MTPSTANEAHGSTSTQLLSEPIVKAFARHETFHPRYGWIKKGFDAAASDSEAFLRPDAAVTLGVGKNMVRAIRYWCRAFKVITELPGSEHSRMLVAEPTAFGTALLADEGWDPYLENPASLWLLHWQLLKAPCFAPAWYAVFNGTYIGSVTDSALLREVELMRDAHPAWADVVDASLKKDVDCLLRMYAPRRAKNKSLEDTLDSPFGALGLIGAVEADRHLYNIQMGPKEGLSDEVVMYSILDFMAGRAAAGGKTVLFSRLAYDENSPGRIFRLGESDLTSAARRFAAGMAEIDVVEVAGSPQLVLRQPPSGLALEALRRLYEGVGSVAG